MVFWMKEKLRWTIFLGQVNANQWNEMYEEILKNIPDNVVVYNFNGEVEFENEFLKKFRSIIESESILEAIFDVKRRGNFTSTHSYIETKKSELTDVVTLRTEEILYASSDNDLIRKNSFKDLSEVLLILQRLHKEGLVASKDLIVFDGRCILKSTGETLSIEIRLSIFEDIETENKKFLIILRDTTQRDIMATLESNNKFKDNLLASVSHELRTPLNGFKAVIDSCLLDTEVPKNIKETYIIPAARSSTLLNSIINDILDYSLLTRKKLQMRYRKVDTLELLTGCYELMKHHYYKQNINFNLKVDERIPQYIHTDPDRLTQIIFNLLSNAFKFTCKGSVDFEAKAQGNNIRILIRDTGIGMDDEKMDKLTDILKESLIGGKVDRSSTGVGLGLIISQAISFLLGPKGSSGIYFESKLKSGSLFTFSIENKDMAPHKEIVNMYDIPSLKRLPKHALAIENIPIELMKTRTEALESSLGSPTQIYLIPPEKGDDSIILSNNPLKRGLQHTFDYLPSYYSRKEARGSSNTELLEKNQSTNIIDACPEILVVDDEPINILALELIFKQLKKKIDKAYGGQEALEIIQKRKEESGSYCPKTYKIIFMDLNMPLVDGYEATRQIKEKVSNREIEDVKIVACTAYQEYEHKKSCLDAGMSDFINKPVTKAKIMDVLEKFNCL